MQHEVKRFDLATSRRSALVICTHLRPGRTQRRSRHYLQPITGLHIASLIDQHYFDVRLYHEDWHGPYDTRCAKPYELVVLTGLQADFDRMRQLSYHFRRLGAVVIAGGSICTLFPEFAAGFFDSVCAGGVDSIPEVVADYLCGTVKPIYRSPQTRITNYAVDYSLFPRNGINPQLHLVESSRGCNFRCSFCAIPAEGARHSSYSQSHVSAAIDSAIASSPLFSLRRWYPMIFFVDNNFSDDRERMLEIADLVSTHSKVRAWGAMVTQDVLHDHDLINRLAVAKCRVIFIGLESLDRDLLRRFNKKQNLSRRSNIIDDILFAESRGICILYGYLFDPRSHTVSNMKAQIALFEATRGLPFPTFFSLILPLAGTASFWEDIQNAALAPNLRLRDLDGETIAYSRLADSPNSVASFVEAFTRRPWLLVNRRRVLLSTLRRIWNARTFNLVQWYVIVASNLRAFIWSRGYPSPRRSYLAGEDVLDPQYSEHPKDITTEDWRRYFEPIEITDDRGGLAQWLQPYAPKQMQVRVQGGPNTEAEDLGAPKTLRSP
ncbi:MAG: radical SAM protein [Methyloceanibacter sp.]